MKVAIIPARGGSKRIEKKNIKNFCGKPIISRSIEIAHKTKLFDKIIVSTENKEIASIARKNNAETPFIRPFKLAGDRIGTEVVISHAIKWLKSQGKDPQAVCCIYPTAVFAKPEDIIKAYKKMINGNWNYVFPAATFQSTVIRSFIKLQNNGVKMLFPNTYNSRTQDLKQTYYDAGQFYWGRPEAWLKLKPIINKSSTIINIPRWRAHDIDTLEDWKQAEIIYKSLMKKKYD